MTRRLALPLWTAVCGAALISCLPGSPSPQEPKQPGTPTGQTGQTPGTGMMTGDPTGGPVNADNRSARAYFTEEVLPSLVGTCGGCHRVDNGVGPGFLKSDPNGDPMKYDPYPIISTWPGFIARLPELSAILRKGTHEGPALIGSDLGCTDQCCLVLEWLRRERIERDAREVVPRSPQTRPFLPDLTPNAYTTVDLLQLGEQYRGAYLRFKITLLSTGAEVSDLRFFNRKPGSQTGEERTIYMKHPLFVVWLGGMPVPDATDNFAGYDRAIALNEDDRDAMGRPIPNAGVLITPGLFTLNRYQRGAYLSVVWEKLQVLLPANPVACKPAGLTIFNNQVARDYLAKPMACAQAGMCHNSTYKAGAIDMAGGFLQASFNAPAQKNTELCATLKFYNTADTIKNNTDPNSTQSHPFRWRPTECAANGLPANCFNNFVTVLNAWRDAEQ